MGLGKYGRSARQLLGILGPGFITGASDDDPSGIGTYSVAGASLGYVLLWLAPVTCVLMVTVQFMCAKIAMVSGTGLAQVIRDHYPRTLLYPIVSAIFVANAINAGADVSAIAAAINLLVPALPATVLMLPIAAVLVAVLALGSYATISRVFKWLTLALFAYVASALLSQPDWAQAARATVIPTVSLNATFMTTVVAVLGTTISPYLFFWQASQEVEEEIDLGRATRLSRRGATKAELSVKLLDVGAGMILSNVVMYFIILACAATLFTSGRTQIQSAADAAEALRPLAGDLAGVLFAVGLIGAGLLAVPVLVASAAYALSEAFKWRHGLDVHYTRAPQFYVTMAIATLLGTASMLFGIDPIASLYWSAVINGVLAAPVLVLVMLIANNRAVMGQRVNNRWTNALGWFTTVLMAAPVLILIANLRTGS